MSPDDILRPLKVLKRHDKLEYKDNDPKGGFSLRNLQIKACWLPTVNDIVTYEENKTP